MSSAPQFTEKGIELISAAVKNDNAGKKQEALDGYTQGLQYLMMANKYEKNPRIKTTLDEKITEYLNRAEALKKELSQPPKEEKKAEADKDSEKFKSALASAIVQEKPNVNWEDIAGLETAKSLLKETVILPIRFPQLFTGKRTPWRGILLFGPPGTGKSYLAKAVATEADSTFFSVSSSDLVSKYVGDSEKMIKTLFDMARDARPSIIFIDEIDSLCGNRSDNEADSSRRVKTEFLVQMQGVGSDNEGILVLGATNTPWDLDPAIRRRFEKRIYIPLPDAPAREAMLRLHLGNTPNNLTNADFHDLGHMTGGFSGSDISSVVRDALYEPLRSLQIATHFKKIPDPSGSRPFLWCPCAPSDAAAVEKDLYSIPSADLHPMDVTADDFRRIALSAKPSVSEADIYRHVKWTEDFGQEGG